MSNEELVNAYTEGRVSRRSLIQGLVAAGVSTGAAVSYAHLLAPRASGAARRPWADEYPSACTEEYPSIDMLVLDRKLAVVRRERKLRVKARFVDGGFPSGPTPGKARIQLEVRAKKNGMRTVLGEKTFAFTAGKAREVSVPLADVSPLRGVDKVSVSVLARRVDSDVFCKARDPYNLVRIGGRLS